MLPELAEIPWLALHPGQMPRVAVPADVRPAEMLRAVGLGVVLVVVPAAVLQMAAVPAATDRAVVLAVVQVAARVVPRAAVLEAVRVVALAGGRVVARAVVLEAVPVVGLVVERTDRAGFDYRGRNGPLPTD